jgi:hypothetical protein
MRRGNKLDRSRDSKKKRVVTHGSNGPIASEGIGSVKSRVFDYYPPTKPPQAMRRAGKPLGYKRISPASEEGREIAARALTISPQAPARAASPVDLGDPIGALFAKLAELDDRPKQKGRPRKGRKVK